MKKIRLFVCFIKKNENEEKDLLSSREGKDENQNGKLDIPVKTLFNPKKHAFSPNIVVFTI